MSDNLYDVLRKNGAWDMNAVCLEAPGSLKLTYGEVETRTARIANALVGAGVTPGDRVAVQVEKSTRALMLYLACLRAGAVFLPLNTGYTTSELAYFFADAEPSVIVCDPARLQAMKDLPEAAAVLHTLDSDGRGSLADAGDAGDPTFATASRTADDLAAILYTSGTTGRSKGAMLSHGNLGANARTLKQAWDFVPGDVLLHALPIFHVHGLFVATNTALMTGARMIFLPRFDAKEVLEQLPRSTVFMGVPTFYTRLLAQPGLTPKACANMRLFISGSAPLLADTFHSFEKRTGQRILERYGMTETSMNTSNPLHGERRAGTVGPALAGTDVRVCDEAGKTLPPGATGVLEVRGANVFSGYWRMPEKTREEFRDDGFFITGDIARIDTDGYVSIVGRARDLIITGGYNVYPKEIESVVDVIEGVVESAVIGAPHADFGEGVVAVVVRAGGAGVDSASIIAACRAQLAAFKVPKVVVFTDELPRNSMGKVQKNILRDAHVEAFA